MTAGFTRPGLADLPNGRADDLQARGQIIKVVTVHAADQTAAVAVALAVMSDALERPIAPLADGAVVPT